LNRAIFLYEPLQLKERERLNKLPVDSAILRSLRREIDSTAFARAQGLDTEEAYNFFLKHFPSSLDYGDAMLLLHDAAYRSALEEGTYQAFDLFLKKYPDSRHREEARENYDRHLFETKTSDKRLATYRAYLRENPRSPYRRVVEEQILEISCASGEPDSLIQFIRDYPDGPPARKARNILYYVLKDMEGKTFPEFLMTDSLNIIQQLNRKYLVPVLSSGHFGFMNNEGTEIIHGTSDEVYEQYLCGNITEDVIADGDRLMARNEAVIYRGDIEGLDDLGVGFLLITLSDGKRIVLHKSGFIISGDNQIEDAYIPNGRIIALKLGDGWLLFTLAGKQLIDTVWQDVKDVNGALALKKDDRWYLLSGKQIGLIADRHPFDFSESFDEVKEWPNNFIWVKRNGEEAIFDQHLNVRVPLEAQVLKFYTQGFESRFPSGVRFLDTSFNDAGVFEDIIVGQQWIGTRVGDKWKFLDPIQKNFLVQNFDSISFVGTFPIGYRQDSLRVYFNSRKFLDFEKTEVNYIAGKDSSAYLLITVGKKRILYSHHGDQLCEVGYDNVQLVDKGIFAVSKREKKGLMAENGKMLLPPTYDAIGDGDGTNIPLLRSMKFGLYNLKTKKEIVPQYDKNLKRYGENRIIAFKNGNLGIVDSKNKTILPFEYEDIVYWNDSSAFVKKNALWQLIDIGSKKVILDQVRAFKFVNDSKKEKVIIAQQGDAFGVMSNVSGIVLPLSYTDIINIGSQEDPLYFTEKNVQEANIFVVIYYDKHGKLIRRQAFEPDEYEMIYCSNN
ncbi:MAG TPA: WG repeat-containing protein, partial [Cyclobacteriaceae bacterium]|nr:WG repeat-containing protein [Cyclobacteriaceae bacterium]